MLRYWIILKDVLSREEGQDLVEYVLIASLIALACISGVGGFGVLVAAMVSALVKAAAALLGG
jgi:Flp pilus assembly pilin Flp